MWAASLRRHLSRRQLWATNNLSNGHADLVASPMLELRALERTGAALARRMRERGVTVLEINRPDRSRRRLRGKSDPTDAENAARAVLAGDARAIPKTQCGVVEAMRAVTMARRSAVKAKTQAINQLRALLVTAPEAIRATLWKVKPEHCVARCARLQSLGDTPLLKALTNTLRLLARRWLSLAKELRELDAALARLTNQAGRRLLTQFGVGPQTAATLLVTAGDNPDRHAVKQHWLRCAVSAHWRRPRERRCDIASIAVVIARPTTRCGRSRWYVCAASRGPAPTLRAAPLKVDRRRKFSDVSSVTLCVNSIH